MAAGGVNVLADVGLGGSAVPSGAAAWCRVSNLLALGLAPTNPHEATVLLLEPASPGEATRLRVPLGPAEGAPPGGGLAPPRGVAQLEWSPPGCPRLLVVLTHCGRLFGFRQPQPSPTVKPPTISTKS